jgi:hypothetical protein
VGYGGVYIPVIPLWYGGVKISLTQLGYRSV